MDKVRRILRAIRDHDLTLARNILKDQDCSWTLLDNLIHIITENLQDQREQLRENDGKASLSTLPPIYPYNITKCLDLYKEVGGDISGWGIQSDSLMDTVEHVLQAVGKPVRDVIRSYTQFPSLNQNLKEATTLGYFDTKQLAEYEESASILLYDIRAMDYVLENCEPLKEDLVTYRGIKLKDIKSFSLQTGAYVSVTTNMYVAKQFSKGCCVFKIVLPKGSKVMSVKGISQFPEQEEIILPRNTIFKLTDEVEVVDCEKVFVLEYIAPSSIKYDYEKIFDEVKALSKHWDEYNIELLSWDAVQYTAFRRGRIVIDEIKRERVLNDKQTVKQTPALRRSSRLRSKSSKQKGSKTQDQYTCDLLEGTEKNVHYGKGSNATVFILDDRIVKVYEIIGVDEDGESVDRSKMFENEVRMMHYMNNSGVTPKIIDSKLCGNKAFIIMERIHGATMKSFLESSLQTNKMNVQLVTKITASLMEALLILEKFGLVHRDLHAENVIVNELQDGSLEVKFIDLAESTSKGNTISNMTQIFDEMEHIVRGIKEHMYNNTGFIPMYNPQTGDVLRSRNWSDKYPNGTLQKMPKPWRAKNTQSGGFLLKLLGA